MNWLFNKVFGQDSDNSSKRIVGEPMGSYAYRQIFAKDRIVNEFFNSKSEIVKGITIPILAKQPGSDVEIVLLISSFVRMFITGAFINYPELGKIFLNDWYEAMKLDIASRGVTIKKESFLNDRFEQYKVQWDLFYVRTNAENLDERMDKIMNSWDSIPLLYSIYYKPCYFSVSEMPDWWQYSDQKGGSLFLAGAMSSQAKYCEEYLNKQISINGLQ